MKMKIFQFILIQLFFTNLNSQNVMFTRVGDSDFEFLPSDSFRYDAKMDWYGQRDFCFSFLVLPTDFQPNPDQSSKPILHSGYEIMDSMDFKLEGKSVPLYLVKASYMPGEETIESISIFNDENNLIMLNINFEDLQHFYLKKNELLSCLSTIRRIKH